MKVTSYVCDGCGKLIDPIGEGLGSPQDPFHFCSRECRDEYMLHSQEWEDYQVSKAEEMII